MRKFNQTINVEMEVDAIANQLLNTINEDTPNRESIVEAIFTNLIGSKDAIQHLYNALNGNIPKINFKVGDIINCKATTWMYVSEKSRLEQDSERAELGKAVIVAINPFRNDPLYVEYDYYNADGSIRKDKTWVKQQQCSFAFHVDEEVFS
jgi:hypothetical protein